MGKKVISSLLVGIGLDFDEKSTRGVESGFSSVKSAALKLGAVVAGAFGVNTLTAGFARTNDALGKFSETYGVVANDVAAFDRALKKSGGQTGDFISQLSGLERLRAATLVGDFGFIEAASKAGIDTRAIIDAESATDAYLSLADRFAAASQKQRFNMANSIGLDESSIRLLSIGRERLSALIAEEKKRRPVTQDMLDMSKKFNEEWIDLNANIGRVSDSLSIKILPQINSLISGFNDWLDANGDLVNSGIISFFTGVGEGAKLAADGISAVVEASKALGLIDRKKGEQQYSGGAIAEFVGPETMRKIGDAIGPGIENIYDFFSGRGDFSGSSPVLTGITPSQSAAMSSSPVYQRSSSSTPKIPDIYINHKTVIDGDVIERATTRVLDNSVRTMADELRSIAQ